MAGEAGPSARDHLGDLGQHPRIDAGLRGRVAEGELGVEGGEHVLECLERDRQVRVAFGQVFGPVPPPADELPVIAPGLDQMVGDGQVDRGFAAWLRG
jgi:hypothetical protein